MPGFAASKAAMTLSNWAVSGSLCVCQYWMVTGSEASVGTSVAASVDASVGASVATLDGSVSGAEVGAAAGPQAVRTVAETISELTNIHTKRFVFISPYLHF